MNDDLKQPPVVHGQVFMRKLFALGLIAVLVATCLTLLWLAAGPNAVSSRVLGIPDVSPAHMPVGLTVTLSRRGTLFAPRVAVIAAGGSVTFDDTINTPVDIHAAPQSPATFRLHLNPDEHHTIRLSRPGLYHYYDALTAHPVGVVDNNEVLNATGGVGAPREGWIAVVPGPPGLQAQLTVPRNQDLFTPKALVTIVGSTVVVSNHDADAHNFVIDPGSPSGAAFIIDGTDREPPSGWQRDLIVQQPGLYHLYCTMHTKVVGTVDGWHLVVPRRAASGFHDHNPMEAWIIALPATTR